MRVDLDEADSSRALGEVRAESRPAWLSLARELAISRRSIIAIHVAHQQRARLVQEDRGVVTTVDELGERD